MATTHPRIPPFRHDDDVAAVSRHHYASPSRHDSDVAPHLVRLFVATIRVTVFAPNDDDDDLSMSDGPFFFLLVFLSILLLQFSIVFLEYLSRY